jgi:hypothetical protein
VATAPVTSTTLAASYNVTSADLAVVGDWTCTIRNETLNNIVFDTRILYQSNYELLAASFDVELLNLVLAEVLALAQISVHLQSSASPTEDDTYVTWSPVVGNLLPGSYKGMTKYSTHVDDPAPDGHHYRIVGMDAQSIQLYVAGATPEIILSVNFGGQKGAFKELDDIAPGLQEDIDTSQLEVDVHVGFDGVIKPLCQAQAALETDSFGDTAVHTLDDIYNFLSGNSGTDVSGDMQSQFEQEISSRINALVTAQTVKGIIDSLFIRIMRLQAVSGAIPAGTGYQANVQSYAIDANGALVVTYYLVPYQLPPVLRTGLTGLATHEFTPAAPQTPVSRAPLPPGIRSTALERPE